MRRILEQARKELIQVIRDKRAMLMALGIPVMLLIPLSVSLSLTVDDLPIVVQDLDDSTASRLFIDAFRASITFRVIEWPVDEHPEAAFKANAAREPTRYRNLSVADPMPRSIRGHHTSQKRTDKFASRPPVAVKQQKTEHHVWPRGCFRVRHDTRARPPLCSAYTSQIPRFHRRRCTLPS